MKPVPFEYFAPTRLEEALEHMGNLGYDGKVLAGGQSLIPSMNFRVARPGALVDLNGVAELQYIRPSAEGGLAIGAMTRDSKVEHDPEVIQRYPLIAEVMPHIAHPQIRSRGTFGGAVAHADPAGQLPAITLALKADMKLMKTGGERWVSSEEFFTGPFATMLEPDEILVEVKLPPLPQRTGSSYHQISRQRGGYAQAAVASLVSVDEGGRCTSARMTLISVSYIPVLSQAAVDILVGQKPTREAFEAVAEAAATTEIDPGSDVHATEEYRRQLVRVLIVRSLTDAFHRAAL